MKKDYLICRICCLKIDQDLCQNNALEFQDKLYYIAGIILQSDQPQTICDSCINELDISFNFKQKCEQSEQFYADKKFKTESICVEVVEENLEDLLNCHIINEDSTENQIESLTSTDFDVSSTLAPTVENIILVEDNVTDTKSKYNKSLKCEECNKKYLKYSSLNTHYQKDHGFQKSHSCDQCNRKFYTNTQLEYHKVSKCSKLGHESVKSTSVDHDKLSSCSHCNKSMGSRYLSRHIEEIHLKKNINLKFLTCDLCGENYKTKSGIIDHMKRKHLSAEYKCSFCDAIFPSYGIRRTHEIHFHTFNYKYSCTFCDHKFITNRDYRKHIVTHTGEKNFLCTICGLRVSRKGVLDLHMATHTDARPHKCQQCGAAFKTRKALKVHYNVHEERKYECPACFQRFLVNQAMRQHVAKRHPDYKLPPPGTIMNKNALKRIEEISTKYNLKVNSTQLHMMQGLAVENPEKKVVNARSLINTKLNPTSPSEMSSENVSYQIEYEIITS